MRNLYVATAFISDILPRMKRVQRVLAEVPRWSVLALLIASASPSQAADSLTWRTDRDAVDADISSWSLFRTLEQVAEATGWQIYLEPGLQRKVSTKFKDRTRDKALDMLLGNLGRVLLPGTNGGPQRFLVFRTSERDATRLVRATRKGAKPIPNELLVRMKKGKKVDDLAKKLGAKVVGESEGLNSARLQFQDEEATSAAREALLNDEDVNSVDPNFPVTAQPTLENSGGPTMPDLKLQPIKEGEGIVIGLIDTAIQKQGNNFDNFLLPSISVAGGATPSAEQPTHGTSMYETILRGIGTFGEDGASRVRILPIDVYGDKGTTTTYEVANGIYQALQNGAQIINLSLGSEGDTPYLHDIIQKGTEAGRVFVGSAGNTPVTTPTYPAAYPEVIGVTAGDTRDRIASYANRGDFVDAMAPGNSVVPFNGQNWRISGTSPAAAYFSGAVAVTIDKTGQNAAQSALAVQRSLPVPQVQRGP